MLLAVALSTAACYVLLVAFKPATLETGYVMGGISAPAIIRVYEEKNDNTKGRELLSERWIQRDEKIQLTTETGRIIYDYKYRGDDSWKTDVHAWCHRNDITKVP